jgi:glycosyltransferase involved in cell wall biosynthesis
LVIAGRGPQQGQLLQQLERLNSEHPSLKNRVQIVGWLDQPRSWMRQAEILVLPAQYEGMPNVCLEAMAEGTPVVAFDVQGVRELLGEPSDGVVVPVQDRQAWADSIVKIATDPTFRKTVSLRNRQKIENDFRLSSQLQKYVELYLSLD